MKRWATNTFRSLKGYNFRLWAAGSLVSNIGTWMQRIAQDWLVLTVLTQHSASAVGITMGLQFAPQLLLLPLTGFAADHFDKRKLMMVTQALMGTLALILGALTISGMVQLWQVYAFAFLFGAVAAFDAPARQAFVSELVGEKDLTNAVALNSTTFNAARMIGPAVAGLVIGSVGLGWAFLLNGASYGAVLLSLFLLRVKDLHANARATRKRGSLLEGFRYVWARAELRVLLVMLGLIGTFGLNFGIYTSVMAVKVFHVGASGYGLLSSMMALGTVSGALIVASWERPRFPYLLASAALFGLGCIFGALAPDYWLFGAALALTGVSVLMFLNASNGLMQLTTEPSMRGRVLAIRMAITLGGVPLGAPIVGWVADHFGPRWAIGVGAAAGLTAALIGLIYLRRSRLPATVEGQALTETGSREPG
ncbi:MFS transporter [Stakelama sediminis]|uniref:MFS family permease n=1 Tax=Stakelama sediminis TaxID=463200 RepID=A0A840Z031_9SPHN|nr:MFS family permease [Stakelama sediminis]